MRFGFLLLILEVLSRIELLLILPKYIVDKTSSKFRPWGFDSGLMAGGAQNFIVDECCMCERVMI